MSYIDKGLAYATAVAQKSDCPNFRVGAVLMKGRKCVAMGRNWFRKSHTKSKTIWNGIHAEFNCLHGMDPSKTKGCTIFVVRITNNGDLAMARPCEECQNLLQSYGVRTFYYTDFNGELQMEPV